MKPFLLLSVLVIAGCTQNEANRTEAPAQPASRPTVNAGAASTPAPPVQTPPVQTVGPLADQPTFNSPDAAVDALDKAARAGDLAQMCRVVGLPIDEVREDGVNDKDLVARFTAAYDEFHKIVVNPQDDRKAQLFIGHDNYPLASPLIRTDSKWYFDSAGGKQELRSRVIGENELNTIGVCRAYVQAQYEYYSLDRDGDEVLQYAQHLASTKGKHDGLYWHVEGDQAESPLGPLVAQARAEGYLRGSAQNIESPKPYHGYLFKVLTQQGPKAAGGEYSYIINGRMIAGFAMVAVPAKYGKSGVMTFQVGANGKVYQKDLGADAPESVMQRYEPDESWTLVQE